MRPCLFLYAAVLLPLAGDAADYAVLGYETIDIPVGSQGAAHDALPRPAAGMSADAVRAHFGEPSTRTPPVGEPPISRWIYPAFTVYFEGDIALHSVLHPVATE